MRSKHSFCPGPVDGLEDRLALSHAAVASPAALVAASRPARDPETARFEVQWMRGMINHHGMAIRMANIVLRNGQDPEVHQLARNIIAAQSREIRAMQTWLSSGYGVKGVKPRVDAEGRMTLHQLQSLEGNALDIAFLQEMIGHHSTAVEDAGECLANATHARLRQLCTNIQTTQTAEIGQMTMILERLGGEVPSGGHEG